MRVLGDLGQHDVRSERHRARVDFQNLQPRLRVRHADFDFAIEAAGPAERRIEDFRNVRRAHHDHLAARHESVHQTQKLRYDALFDFADDVGALRRDGVDLVDEENRRRMACRFLEDLSELRLALPVELPHDLGAVEMDEVDAALRGDGAREQRLAGAGRTVQENALRREDAEALEDPRVLQRELDDLADARHLALEPADVLVRHRRRACGRLLAFDDADVGARADDDRPARDRADDLKVHRLGERRHAHGAALDERHADQILEQPFGRDDGRRRAGPQRREPDCHGGGRFDRRHCDLLFQSGAAVAAHGAVHLNQAVVRGIRNVRARDCNGATDNLQCVARPRADALEVSRREAGHGMRDVLDASLGHAKRDRRSGRGGRGLAHEVDASNRVLSCCANRSKTLVSFCFSA